MRRPAVRRCCGSGAAAGRGHGRAPEGGLGLLRGVDRAAGCAAAAAILAATGAGWRAWAWWLGALDGALVGMAGYRGAVSAALVFAEVVRGCFDLSRRDLIKQLGYAIPASLEDERRLWHNLASSSPGSARTTSPPCQPLVRQLPGRNR